MPTPAPVMIIAGLCGPLLSGPREVRSGRTVAALYGSLATWLGTAVIWQRPGAHGGLQRDAWCWLCVVNSTKEWHGNAMALWAGIVTQKLPEFHCRTSCVMHLIAFSAAVL